MYYVIVPSELCARRKVFTRNPRTADGRTVLTMRDLNLIRFSLGPVELVNDTDLAALMQPQQQEPEQQEQEQQQDTETDTDSTNQTEEEDMTDDEDNQ